MNVTVCKIPEHSKMVIIHDNDVVGLCGPFIMSNAVFGSGYIDGELIAASDLELYEDLNLFENANHIDVMKITGKIESLKMVLEINSTFYTTDGAEVMYSDFLINLQGIWLIPIYRGAK